MLVRCMVGLNVGFVVKLRSLVGMKDGAFVVTVGIAEGAA